MKKILLILYLLTASGSGQSNRATMTIYKDGIALIKQPVTWEVESGVQVVSFDQLPPGIYADSPFLMLNGADIQLQRLNEDIFSAEKFLRRNMGYDIKVKILEGRSKSGELVEYDGSRVSLRKRKKITQIPMRNIESITFKADTDEEKLKPSLEWTVKASTEKIINGHLVYLSSGFRWNAVYRMIIEGNTTRASFIPEAFVTNSSSLDFDNTRMSLVEGTLAKPGQGRHDQKQMIMAERMVSTGVTTTADDEKLGDFYIYDLPGKFNFNAAEGMTVRLYNPRSINFNKTYLFENTELAQHEEPLEVEFKFSNSRENDLDMPLPAGKISIYTTRPDGSLEYIGQDALSQIPRGQDVDITAGRSFDVTGKRKVLNYDRQKKSEEAVIQIQVVNSGDERVNARIIEHIHGDWVIRDASMNYIKSDASTIYFPVTVEPGSETYVTYTYRKEWK